MPSRIEVVFVAVVVSVGALLGHYLTPRHHAGSIAPAAVQQQLAAIQADFRNGILAPVVNSERLQTWADANPGEYAGILRQLENPAGPAYPARTVIGQLLTNAVQMYGYANGAPLTLPAQP